MTSSIRSLPCLFVLALAACGGSKQDPGDDTPPGDDVDASGEPGGLDPAACAPIAASFVAAAETCGTTLPDGAAAAFKTMCERGVAAASLCGGDPARGMDCFATPDGTDWACDGAEPLPSCNGDLAASLGMYCLVALGNPSCASGIQCQFDADCSGGTECNGATGQCFDTSAYCIGLPCDFDADCPDDETCNNAEGACVGE